MVLVGYVLLVALGGLVAGLECKNGALDVRFFFARRIPWKYMQIHVLFGGFLLRCLGCMLGRILWDN